MKMLLDIDIEKEGQSARWHNTSHIRLRFTHCTYEEFYAWLNKTAERRKTLCEKWGWAQDIGYSDKGILFSKD